MVALVVLLAQTGCAADDSELPPPPPAPPPRARPVKPSQSERPIPAPLPTLGAPSGSQVLAPQTVPSPSSASVSVTNRVFAPPQGASPLPVPGFLPLPIPPTVRTGTARPTVPAQQEKVFAWDSVIKEYSAKTGEVSAPFTFNLTNISDGEVTINYVRTSCGCTVAKLPTVPWHLPAGTNGAIQVTVDLRGKAGTLSKTVTVDSSAGYRYLTVRVSIPAVPRAGMASADRLKNLQLSMADRQAVFKNDCASCHLTPTLGKKGAALYSDACGVCHEGPNRATMVPNLRALNKPTDRDYWKTWISQGKTNTLMPAWSIAFGGPLSEAQVDSLVDYLDGPFKIHAKAPTAPSPHPTE